MTDAFAGTGVHKRPVIYAGRLADRIAGDTPSSDYVVLREQDALPHKLTGVLDRANTLVLLDPLSFPFGAMTSEHWDVPMVVTLPPDLDAEALVGALGPVLFERLGFFDRVVVPDPNLWGELRRRYRWAEGQRVTVASDDPGEALGKIHALMAEPQAPTIPGGISGKMLHRVQAAALEPRFAAARGDRGTEDRLDVLEVGAGAGSWASSFDPASTRFVGIEAREDLVKTARANFPEGRFDLLGPDLLFPYEEQSFDLAFSVTTMHHNPAAAKRKLLSEMWRVTRPGGLLLFLEDFVFTSRPEEPAVHPMSVTEFVDLILEATAGQVLLEYAESLRYPGEDLRRGGLISLSRLGVPRK